MGTDLLYNMDYILRNKMILKNMKNNLIVIMCTLCVLWGCADVKGGIQTENLAITLETKRKDGELYALVKVDNRNQDSVILKTAFGGVDVPFHIYDSNGRLIGELGDSLPKIDGHKCEKNSKSVFKFKIHLKSHIEETAIDGATLKFSLGVKSSSEEKPKLWSLQF